MKVFCLNDRELTGKKANVIARKAMIKGFSKLDQVDKVQAYYITGKQEKSVLNELSNIDKVALNSFNIPDYKYRGEKNSFRKFVYDDLFVKSLKRLMVFYYFLMLITEVEKNDLVYIRGEKPGFAAYLANYLTDVDYVYEKHNFEFGKETFPDIINYRIFNHATILVTVSEYTKNNWVDHGINPEKIEILPSGVEIKKFNVDESKRKSRKRLNLPLEKFLVIYTGHLYEWKGIETIIDSAELIDSKNVTFYIIGGLKRDLQKYKHEIKDRKFDNINLVGYENHKKIPYYLNASDALLLPNNRDDKSKYHTSPLKLFEYMASGKPILASDLPSVRQVLDENKCYFFEPEKPRDFIEKLEKIKENPVEASQKSAKAKNASEKYSWKKRCLKIIEKTKK